MKLICFPHAGGSIAHLRAWQDYLLPGIRIELVHFPGHGARVGEQPIDRMEPLVNLIANELNISEGNQFAFFGHSMGALVAFEVARTLTERFLPGPVMLFASACPAPRTFDINPKISNLPDDEFMSRLQSLAGTAPEILANSELMTLLMPGLRADFAVCENYEYRRQNPLSCKVWVWGGSTDDEVDANSLKIWQEETNNDCSIEMVEGDHFFVYYQWPSMIRTLNQELSRWVQGGILPP